MLTPDTMTRSADGSTAMTSPTVPLSLPEITKRRSDGSEYQSTRAVRIARKTGEEI